MSNRNCPVCNGYESVAFYSQAFDIYEDCPVSSNYNLVACTTCGMVFADVMFTQADYDRYYSEYNTYSKPQDDKKRFITTALQIKKEFPNRDARILDIGCGPGELLQCLKCIGYTDLTGMSPSQECCDRLWDLKLRYLHASFSTKIQTDDKYDLIILSHVLEHIRDFQPVFQCLKALLKPTGHIYVEVPNANAYYKSVFSPFHEINAEHINHFSSNSLMNMMANCGYETDIISLKDVEFHHSPAYSCICGFFHESKKRDEEPKFFDVTTMRYMDRYISKSVEMIHDMRQKITAKCFYVWGCFSCGGTPSEWPKLRCSCFY